VNKTKCAEESVIIEKLLGETGDKRKGFVLIEAMGLDGNDWDRKQYKAMLVSFFIKTCCYHISDTITLL
jgi:hypothetical protein